MKILFVMEQGIGNMVMATPALQAIKRHNPNSHLTILGINPALQILEYADFVDEKCTQIDKNRQFDCILMSIWSDKFKHDYGREWIQTHTRFAIETQIVNPDGHESEYHMASVRDLGYQGEKPKPFVSVDDNNVDIEDVLDAFNPVHSQFLSAVKNDGMPYVCLADTTVNVTWERKRWKYYPELAQLLIENDCHVVLVGGEKEKAQFNPDDYPSNVTPLFDLTLPKTAKILQNAEFFIGNDSGPAHMSAALGTESYVIFGASRWTKNEPMGERVHIIRKPMACSPCQFQPHWSICQNFECMDIPAEFVFECIKYPVYLNEAMP